MKKLSFIFCFLLCYCLVFSQVKESVENYILNSANLVNDVEFYFTKYDYYLNVKSTDTSLLYLKLNIKRTDVQRLSPKPYTGEYDFAKFNIDRAKKLITVDLYDSMKNFRLKEVYKYSNKQQQQEEINFHNLSSATDKIKHTVIIPVLQ